MQLKAILLSLVLSSAILPALAQDRIYTKSGGVFEVKIKEIGTRTIVYKKWSNQNGPDYVMPKKDVDHVRYQNGDEEVLDAHNKPQPILERGAARNGQEYGRNIISISPIHMTNTSAVGFGLSYERMLDKNSIVSLYIPVVYSFKNNGNSYYNPSSGLYDKDKTRMIWFYPGAKIYPTGSDGIVRYGVGPTLAFGSGKRELTRDEWNPASQAYVTRHYDENVTVMGFLVSNSLNIQPSPKLHLGLELGLGIPYYVSDKENNYTFGYNSYDDEPLVQFNFSIGYRF